MASAQPTKKSEVRSDPEYRIADFENAFDLVGKNPERSYKWVSKSTPADAQGLDWHENVAGYEVEIWREGGIRPACMKFKAEREGKEIVVADHVLMSLPKHVAAARWKAGQDKTTKIEQQIVRRRGQHDPMRGIGRLVGEQFRDDRYVSHVNDVGPLTTHIGES